MKLFQFTLFCILNSLCCVFANAQIIYTNVNPDRYYLNGVYNLDLNNDGTNEGFNVKGWYIEYVDLNIFNRWGDLIFHSEGKNNDSWIGTVVNQTEQAPEGVYVYNVSVRDVWGKNHQKTGLVNLIR